MTPTERRILAERHKVAPDVMFNYSASYVLSHLRGLVGTYKSQRDCAKALGISAAYLSDILQLRRDPGPSILKPLGFTARTVYVRDAAAKKRRKK